MAGLNHEMSRELLWNNYPSDQRGSYFRQFWDVRCYVPTPSDPTDPAALHELLKYIPQIHRWPRARGARQEPEQAGFWGRSHPARSRRPPPEVPQHDRLRVPGGVESDDTAARHPGSRGPQVSAVPRNAVARRDILRVRSDAEEALGDRVDHTKPQGWFFVFQEQPN